jgi:hypothetical protein
VSGHGDAEGYKGYLLNKSLLAQLMTTYAVGQQANSKACQ